MKFKEIYNNSEYFDIHGEVKFYAFCEKCGYIKTKDKIEHPHECCKYEAYVDNEVKRKIDKCFKNKNEVSNGNSTKCRIQTQ